MQAFASSCPHSFHCSRLRPCTFCLNSVIFENFLSIPVFVICSNLSRRIAITSMSSTDTIGSVMIAADVAGAACCCRCCAAAYSSAAGRSSPPHSTSVGPLVGRDDDRFCPDDDEDDDSSAAVVALTRVRTNAGTRRSLGSRPLQSDSARIGNQYTQCQNMALGKC